VTFRGHVSNGMVVLDQTASLPEGASVEVAVLDAPEKDEGDKPSWMVAVEMGESVPVEEWDRLPADGARNLDHYLYGAPKKEA